MDGQILVDYVRRHYHNMVTQSTLSFIRRALATFIPYDVSWFYTNVKTSFFECFLIFCAVALRYVVS